MFETQDIQLVAALMTEGITSSGARTSEGGFVTFVYEQTPTLMSLVEAYEERDLLVNVGRFVQAQRRVRQGLDTMRRAASSLRF